MPALPGKHTTDAELKRLHHFFEQGLGLAQISQRVHISKTTIKRHRTEWQQAKRAANEAEQTDSNQENQA
ncbi:hypothetical protein K227x_62340 [Rubripirellula lacrimiformis]|uniref:Bacterial regulatory protein, luxR family n=1 Tax=Rubripirellula lacrimiformis TaxID=1930273 RepID=A0A517NL02_9BACT|nr:hypothetical protein [Rubripirellula lacrimiformis]QDT07806.1 hypothetical protein K227x_62340 [Rubripirellula lacrimiformis]